MSAPAGAGLFDLRSLSTEMLLSIHTTVCTGCLVLADSRFDAAVRRILSERGAL